MDFSSIYLRVLFSGLLEFVLIYAREFLNCWFISMGLSPPVRGIPVWSICSLQAFWVIPAYARELW